MRHIVLAAHYYCFEASKAGDGLLSPQDIARRSHGQISSHQAELALVALKKVGTVATSPNVKLGTIQYKLTLEGYTQAETAINDPQSYLSMLAEADGDLGQVSEPATEMNSNAVHAPTVINTPSAGTAVSMVSGPDDGNEAANHGWTQGPVESAKVPASDRTVQLDHNSENYKALLITLDEAIAAIDGINDRSDFDGETLQRVLELKAGRLYLEAPQVDLSFIEFALVSSLKYLAAKSFSKTVDLAIGAAIAAVLTFFGFSL